jgi:hypothetical protein
MNMLRRLLPILLVLAASAAAQPKNLPAAAHAQSYRIAGTAVNALTGEPLHHAEISIGSPREVEAIQTVDTGTDGRFEFSGLVRGKYWLGAEAPGFPRQAYEQHEQFSTAIAVGPGLASENLLFRVHPDGVISGTISDDQGDAVRDAQVMLFRNAMSEGRKQTGLWRQVGVDDRGYYRFSHLPPGTYFVAVSAQPWYSRYATAASIRLRAGGSSKSGAFPASSERSPLDVAYPITYYSGSTDAVNATPIALNAGDRVAADVTLSPVPALHLRIADPDAAQGQGMNVSLNQSMLGDFSATVNAQVTNLGHGEIEVAGVAPGQYNMQVELYGNDVDSGGAVREQKVDLQNDAEISAGPLSASTQVTGQVQFDGPVPQQAYIRLWNHASSQFLGTQVSDKGEFDIGEPVAPGNYEVTLVNAGGVALGAVTATGAKVDGRMVQITGGGAVRLKVTTIRGLGKIDGTALQAGKPGSGVMIVLVPHDLQNSLSLVRRDQSDSDGTFTLDTVVPGRYTVLAIANGWDLEWQNPEILNSYLSRGQVVRVEPGGKYQIRVNAQ